jgi:hypothetical protein
MIYRHLVLNPTVSLLNVLYFLGCDEAQDQSAGA